MIFSSSGFLNKKLCLKIYKYEFVCKVSFVLIIIIYNQKYVPISIDVYFITLNVKSFQKFLTILYQLQS